MSRDSQEELRVLKNCAASVAEQLRIDAEVSGQLTTQSMPVGRRDALRVHLDGGRNARKEAYERIQAIAKGLGSARYRECIRKELPQINLTSVLVNMYGGGDLLFMMMKGSQGLDLPVSPEASARLRAADRKEIADWEQGKVTKLERTAAFREKSEQCSGDATGILKARAGDAAKGVRIAMPFGDPLARTVRISSDHWEATNAVLKEVSREGGRFFNECLGMDPVEKPHGEVMPTLLGIEASIGRNFSKPDDDTSFDTAMMVCTYETSLEILNGNEKKPRPVAAQEPPAEEGLFQKASRLLGWFLTDSEKPRGEEPLERVASSAVRQSVRLTGFNRYEYDQGPKVYDVEQIGTIQKIAAERGTEIFVRCLEREDPKLKEFNLPGFSPRVSADVGIEYGFVAK